MSHIERTDPAPHGRRQGDEGICVLVLADPGQCDLRVRRIQRKFEQELTTVFGAATVHVRTQFFEINDRNTLEFATLGSTRNDYEQVDVVLLLTEMPRREGGRNLIAEVLPGQTAAVLSYPTVGVLSRDQRMVSLFMACVVRLADGVPEEDRTKFDLPLDRWREMDDAGAIMLPSHTITGVPRTVLGLVATNAPWRTVPKLSSALAAASATGAFGIFYNSIWQMSAVLSTSRLLMIGLLAITLMVLWLVVGNGLWERPVQARSSTVHLYYKLSTVLTLFVCVFALYLALVIMILIAGLVVIDPDFMTQILGEPAKFARYVDIAWLSAAIGVVAGGLGASFDDAADLRHLTHGRREAQRRPA